ncbi:MAG: tRNA 4-thiouridine(8) synthase ThiI [Bacilli bacterium]|nr:tRNA 4-thiouridine(8) synthase ThiI [Bacilli bacterium]
MERVILIKYGELSTKKANRNYFINTLVNSVKNKLSDYEVNIHKDRAKMYIEFKDKDLESIKNIINKIFGIHTYHIAYIVESKDEIIKEELLKAIKSEEFNTFKVEVKRSDKKFPVNSQEYSRDLGALILKNTSDVTVDVHNPELKVKVEIREDKTFIYFNSYVGAGGYPTGTQSKGMLMLSGGIDSPVAGYYALKRGMKLDAIYFEAIPHTSIEARNKVISLSKKLVEYTDCINLHIVNFTPIQEEIYKNCREDYCITIMRRMMYRIASKLCEKYKGLVIVNGESVGQVASQTLTSMRVINEVTNIPVIRPVACMDKIEIMEIARKIDTYDISIIPYEDCCTVFVPKHPVINPKLDTAIKEENKFDYNKLIEEAIDSINTIKIDNSKSTEFRDLL